MKRWEQLHQNLQPYINVPRETFDQLITYHELLLKWQPTINLVSPKTLPNLWERHFLDSIQLFRLISDTKNPIFDLGSGGGFPGLIISILGATEVHLIESDHRKCAFLSEVIRQTGAKAIVETCRIEQYQPQQLAHTITARACAPLDKLLRYSAPLLAAGGKCLFLKGKGAADEVRQAEKLASFHVKQHPSRTDNDSHLLEISQLSLR